MEAAGTVPDSPCQDESVAKGRLGPRYRTAVDALRSAPVLSPKLVLSEDFQESVSLFPCLRVGFSAQRFLQPVNGIVPATEILLT